MVVDIPGGTGDDGVLAGEATVGSSGSHCEVLIMEIEVKRSEVGLLIEAREASELLQELSLKCRGRPEEQNCCRRRKRSDGEEGEGEWRG